MTGNAGLGSNLNLIIWTTALLLQEQPNATIFLDERSTLAACRDGLDELMLPQQPKVLHVNRDKAPPGCVVWSTDAIEGFVRGYTGSHGHWAQYIGRTSRRWMFGGSSDVGFTHMVSLPGMPAASRQRHAQIWHGMWHALCPVMQRFWQFAPQLQQRRKALQQSLRGNSTAPIVAIHVRGGDKVAPGTREVPEEFDYSFHKGMELVAQQLAVRGIASVPQQATQQGSQQQQQQKSETPICLLFGDDKQLMDDVGSQARRILNCSRLQQAPAAGSFTPWGDDNVNCGMVQTMLADMDTLAWADYSIGTMWSNFDSVAFYAAVCNYGRQQETYVDGSRNPFGPYL
jgi:hypothetical protein